MKTIYEIFEPLITNSMTGGGRDYDTHELFAQAKQNILATIKAGLPEKKVHPENGLPTCEKQSCSVSGWNAHHTLVEETLDKLFGSEK